MTKDIVFCADGTWNAPGQDEDHDDLPDPTNVYKLFLQLEGEFSPGSIREADEQEKTQRRNGQTVMVAKYLHGVGDSRNLLVKLMGGAFGSGVISRVVRGFTFISRNYEPGDRIFIVGFSRGAYTARALGGLIASQGLLAKANTDDKEKAYRMGAEAWYRARKASHTGFFAHLAEVVADLPAFLSQENLKPGDLVPVQNIAAIAVWDTVGAMGLPDYAGNGKCLDAFQFADTKLSPKVERGFHAVSLDEQRSVFTPTLWEPRGGVTQVLFPGAHADVGGGYPVSGKQCGLSDGALRWMLDQLAGLGLEFAAGAQPCMPDPAGVAHKPWKEGAWKLLGHGRRAFPAGMPLDPSVGLRMQAGMVVASPGEAAGAYVPQNLPQ